MKTRFIFNPCSGRNRGRPRLASDLQAFVTAHKLDASIVFTECPGHATELAREALADGCERIVAVGGDGTMNETAQALVDSPAALALVPCGSGNGLALHLGLPTRLPAPSRCLPTPLHASWPSTQAPPTAIHSSTPWASASMPKSASASTALTVAGSPHTHARDWRHSSGTAPRESRFPTVMAPGRRWTHSSWPSPTPINMATMPGWRPGARVNDGLLDLVVVRPPGLFGAVPLVARLFLGTLRNSPRVWRLRSFALCHRTTRARSDPHRRRDAPDRRGRACRGPAAQPAPAGPCRLPDRLFPFPLPSPSEPWKEPVSESAR